MSDNGAEVLRQVSSESAVPSHRLDHALGDPMAIEEVAALFGSAISLRGCPICRQALGARSSFSANKSLPGSKNDNNDRKEENCGDLI